MFRVVFMYFSMCMYVYIHIHIVHNYLRYVSYMRIYTPAHKSSKHRLSVRVFYMCTHVHMYDVCVCVWVGGFARDMYMYMYMYRHLHLCMWMYMCEHM